MHVRTYVRTYITVDKYIGTYVHTYVWRYVQKFCENCNWEICYVPIRTTYVRIYNKYILVELRNVGS